MEQLGRIESKLDKITDKLADHGETLVRHEALHARNSDDLEEHIRGVQALEARVRPIESHVADVRRFLKSALWVGGILLTVVGPVVNMLMKHFLKDF